jgi:hypothetical protein
VTKREEREERVRARAQEKAREATDHQVFGEVHEGRWQGWDALHYLEHGIRHDKSLDEDLVDIDYYEDLQQAIHRMRAGLEQYIAYIQARAERALQEKCGRS